MHLVVPPEKIYSAILLPREPLGQWKTILYGKSIWHSNDTVTYIKQLPAPVTFFFGAYSRTVLCTAIDRSGNIVLQIRFWTDDRD